MASSKSAQKSAKKKTQTRSASKTTADLASKPMAESIERATDVVAEKSQKPEVTSPASMFQKLHGWNKWLALLHAVQGIAILVLATTKTLPVTTNYLTVDPITTATSGHPVLVAATRHLFDVNLAWLVAIFFFVSAVAHITLASGYRKRYESDLKLGINKLRWIEYGLSSSIMLVGIGLLSGVYDFASLVMIFALSLIMNLLGLAMEIYNQNRAEINWLAYGIGCIAGIVPWTVFGLYLFGAHLWGSGNVPAFVYWIYGSMFIFFASFAANMYLQYKKKGKWANYLYGERAYMVLSLVAKTALAWQIFAGTLRP